MHLLPPPFECQSHLYYLLASFILWNNSLDSRSDSIDTNFSISVFLGSALDQAHNPMLGGRIRGGHGGTDKSLDTRCAYDAAAVFDVVELSAYTVEHALYDSFIKKPF